MLNNFGNSEVTVKKGELLSILRKNKKNHRSVFIDAQKGYRAQVIAELDQMLDDARNGGRIRRAIELVEPQEHTKDYERVIRMLEMSTASTITVTEAQFRSYVMDEWDWRGAFIGSTVAYNSPKFKSH